MKKIIVLLVLFIFCGKINAQSKYAAKDSIGLLYVAIFDKSFSPPTEKDDYSYDIILDY